MNKEEFNLLYHIFQHQTTKEDLQSVAFSSLTRDGLVSKQGITEQGLKALDQYKVDNAIILAAGYSSRFVPISYETPKGLLSVKGEILIERQIKQLKEAGIHNIIIVVGYLKEKFQYLQDKYQVLIIENKEYSSRNNHSSIYAVKEYLGNSYILCSDNLFTKNVFRSHVYQPYYAAKYAKGQTEEYCLTLDQDNKITDVSIGGNNSWYMFGHIFFSKDFSKKYLSFLEEEYNNPRIKQLYWEDIYIEHIESLDLYVQKYPSEIILEFDSLADLRLYDKDFLHRTGSKYMEHISNFLSCDEEDIVSILPIKEANHEVHFTFQVHGQMYEYFKDHILRIS
ncbi:MAG TPA: NTP transferase domain-containing protein [Candidatus Merdenecus merdavium]|nr:NTP transferase domain-containing protein [Candidatus Merdenecus merdavium]